MKSVQTDSHLDTFKALHHFLEEKMEFILGNKKRIAIPLIWLLIYLSIVPMQLSDYVLCIGTDGHVEIDCNFHRSSRD